MKKRDVLRAWLVLLLFFTLQAAFAWPEDRQTQPPPAPAPVLKDIPVPVIHVKGTHYEAGYQIGTRLKDDILRDVAEMKKSPDWMKVRAEAELFLAYSRKYLSEYVTEIKGAADGSVLAAHNNDTSPSSQDSVVIVHYQVDGEPEIVTVGYGGLGISVGYNSAGISLTGNQVDSNDMRVGVPRLLLVRKILAARTLGEAIDAAILKERASNYNQLITDASGEIYSIEGSATDYAPLYSTDGYLVHTNHYVAPWMRQFEFDTNGITSSIVRYNRGTRLLKRNLGGITVDKMKEFLSDHVNHPGSICRHGKGVKTTFSVIINLTTQTMLLARGNPCEVQYREYNFFAKK